MAMALSIYLGGMWPLPLTLVSLQALLSPLFSASLSSLTLYIPPCASSTSTFLCPHLFLSFDLFTNPSLTMEPWSLELEDPQEHLEQPLAQTSAKASFILCLYISQNCPQPGAAPSVFGVL